MTDGVHALCIVMEHLEQSLADFARNFNNSESLEYLSDDNSSISINGRDIGLNLELVRVIGYQITVFLSLFSMKGLSLIHGSIKAENIFFKKRGVPEFKLIDFSSAFFLDEEPEEEIFEINNEYRAPELEQYAQAIKADSSKKPNVSLEKVD